MEKKYIYIKIDTKLSKLSDKISETGIRHTGKLTFCDFCSGEIESFPCLRQEILRLHGLGKNPSTI